MLWSTHEQKGGKYTDSMDEIVIFEVMLNCFSVSDGE
jgi:hypothetical protein